MWDPSKETAVAVDSHPAPAVPKGAFILWSLLAALALVLAVGAVVVRVLAGPRFDGLLILSACGAALLLALRMPRRVSNATQSAPAAEPLKEVLDAAGPAILSVGLDGRLIYVNPSAERMLGSDAVELMSERSITDILARGQGARIVAEMEKLCNIQRPPEATPAGRLAAFLNCVRALPPSMVPSFEAQLRRKNGDVFPATLHISALRDGSGTISGLVAVASDQSATLRHEQALRESQERYLDLFENSSEMIATLSPAGRFLYANPAWKRCFGLDLAELLALDRFEDLFGTSCRADVAALFRRALDGEPVERAPLRHYTEDGRVFEFELNLSQRQEAGNALAVRCLMRDVTFQKHREHRLALQLVVSQIVGENPSLEVASMRILEALRS